ncbi:hypothetical protein L2E82_47711 [Cichorium intybus]|uniref:Uncharacterized protein n=1 Tax=Cichorium intybus TaxID=13427 RepID=A0ACB8YVF6_CICIN|nr:hypothetical protein L2E82_47711 [Cichorium intybus]
MTNEGKGKILNEQKDDTSRPSTPLTLKSILSKFKNVPKGTPNIYPKNVQEDPNPGQTKTIPSSTTVGTPPSPITIKSTPKKATKETSHPEPPIDIQTTPSLQTKGQTKTIPSSTTVGTPPSPITIKSTPKKATKETSHPEPPIDIQTTPSLQTKATRQSPRINDIFSSKQPTPIEIDTSLPKKTRKKIIAKKKRKQTSKPEKKEKTARKKRRHQWDETDRDDYFCGPLPVLLLAYLEFMTSLKKEKIEIKGLSVNYWDVKKMKRKEDEVILKRSFVDVDIQDDCSESEEETTDEDECMTVEELLSNIQKKYKKLVDDKVKLGNFISSSLIKFPKNNEIIKMKKLFEEQFVGESTKNFDEPEAGDETENREGLNMNNNVEKQGENEPGDETDNREGVNMNKNTEKEGGYEGDDQTENIKGLNVKEARHESEKSVENEEPITPASKKTEVSNILLGTPGDIFTDPKETNEGFGEEKGKKMVNEEDNDNSKEIEEDEDILTTENEEHTEKVSKRVIKPSIYLCSPYHNKNVSMFSFPEVDELKVSNRVFARTGHFSEKVFETEKGTIVLRGMIETLQAELWVHVNVIDAWSAVLNYEEKNRRFFFDTTILRPSLYDLRKPFVERCNKFEEDIKDAMKGEEKLKTFEEIDLVFFPVHSANHYYLICINLKEPRVDVLDNKLSNAKMKNSYHGAPKELSLMFSRMFWNV